MAGVVKVTLFLFLISVGQITFGAEAKKIWKEKPIIAWISGPSKTWTKSKDKCQLFESYWILSREFEDQVGDNIYVFKKNANSKFPEDCDSNLKEAYAHYLDGDYGLADINKDILFLDSGTGNWRGLQIISLKDKKEIASVGYNGSVGEFSIKGEELNYSGPLSESDEDRHSWKIIQKCTWGLQHQPKEFFQGHYSGKRRINLKTGKKSVTDVTCEVGPVAG